MKLNDYTIGEGLYKWLLDNLKKGDTILEFGSGDGSVLLAETFTVFSVEHHLKWLNKHKKVNYIYAPIKNGWYDISYLPYGYNVIIIDGPPGFIGREGILDNLNLIDLSVPIVVDDYHRDVEKMIAHAIEAASGRSGKEYLDNDKSFYVI